MKVKDIPARPLLDVAELRPEAKYAIRIHGHATYENIQHLADNLKAFGVKAVVLDDGADIFEIVE